MTSDRPSGKTTRKSSDRGPSQGRATKAGSSRSSGKKNSPLRQPQAGSVRSSARSGRQEAGGQGRRGASGGHGLMAKVAQLIDLLAHADGPADATISRFFKDNPELGARDRHVVAEGAYCWLRYRLRINHLAQSGEGPSIMRQAKLALLWSGAPEPVWSAGRQADNEWLGRVINVSAEDLPLEPRTCLPEWIVSRLVAQMGVEQAQQFAEAVLHAAPLDLRVNTLKASSEEVVAALAEQGMACAPIEGLPEGLRVEGKPALGRTDQFAQGWFEVQDAGSQWVSKLVAPRRGDLIVDFCAGAGGKTLSIAAQMRNSGKIVVLDTSERRLQKFKPRAVRAGLSNYYTMALNDEADPRLEKFYGKADRVVVDVPCSGLGTLRRNPDLKFRQSPQSVGELVLKQRSILEQASKLVKADGRLIYMTCSVLKEENEDIVQSFLDANPDFRMRRWTEVLNPQDRPKTAPTEDFAFRMWPQWGESDGFFAVVMQRAK